MLNGFPSSSHSRVEPFVPVADRDHGFPYPSTSFPSAAGFIDNLQRYPTQASSNPSFDEQQHTLAMKLNPLLSKDTVFLPLPATAFHTLPENIKDIVRLSCSMMSTAPSTAGSKGWKFDIFQGMVPVSGQVFDQFCAPDIDRLVHSCLISSNPASFDHTQAQDTLPSNKRPAVATQSCVKPLQFSLSSVTPSDRRSEIAMPGGTGMPENFGQLPSARGQPGDITGGQSSGTHQPLDAVPSFAQTHQAHRPDQLRYDYATGRVVSSNPLAAAGALAPQQALRPQENADLSLQQPFSYFANSLQQQPAPAAQSAASVGVPLHVQSRQSQLMLPTFETSPRVEHSSASLTQPLAPAHQEVWVLGAGADALAPTSLGGAPHPLSSPALFAHAQSLLAAGSSSATTQHTPSHTHTPPSSASGHARAPPALGRAEGGSPIVSIQLDDQRSIAVLSAQDLEWLRACKARSLARQQSAPEQLAADLRDASSSGAFGAAGGQQQGAHASTPSSTVNINSGRSQAAAFVSFLKREHEAGTISLRRHGESRMPSHKAKSDEDATSGEEGSGQSRERELKVEERERQNSSPYRETFTDEEGPTGVAEIRVHDCDKWWKAVKQWCKPDDESEDFNSLAFFMMLRRFGLKPYNKAPPPATSGSDYGLKRHDVEKHGYVYTPLLYCRYKKRSVQAGAAEEKRACSKHPRQTE